MTLSFYHNQESGLYLQLYSAKSHYWLHKAGASPEHWTINIDKDNPTSSLLSTDKQFSGVFLVIYVRVNLPFGMQYSCFLDSTQKKTCCIVQRQHILNDTFFIQKHNNRSKKIAHFKLAPILNISLSFLRINMDFWNRNIENLIKQAQQN